MGPRLRVRALAFLAAAVLLGPALPAHSDIHRYRDDSGQIHVVRDEQEIPPEYRSRAITIKTKPRPKRTARSERPSTSTESVVSQPPVEIYVTSWCGYCRKLERFLQEKSIRYTRYDIEESSSAKKRYRELGGTGVPVVKVGSQVIRGYSPEAILRALGKGTGRSESAVPGFSTGSWPLWKIILAVVSGTWVLRRLGKVL